MRLWASEMAVVMEAVGGERARERGGLRDMAQGQGGWQMTFTEGVGLRFMFSLSPESTLSILKQELFRNEKET